MNDPWQILILDSNTATEKDVKAAYARLLKQHRPDTDPEGFRRVREAYEAALASIRDRDARGGPTASYAVNPEGQPDANDSRVGATLPESPLELPLPEEVRETFAEVEHAASLDNEEQLEAALSAFHKQCETLAVPSPSVSAALERVFTGNVKLLAAAASDHLLMTLAISGEVNLPHLILSAWVEEEKRERIALFGRALMDNLPALTSPEAALLVARVGVLIGLEAPEMASSLGNAAYPHLPLESRNHIMAQLQHEIALGRVFADVSPAKQTFWFERLRHSREEHDWQSTESQSAVDDLIRNNRYVWQGWGIIHQLLPEDRWAQVEPLLRKQAQQVAQSTPGKAGFPRWLFVLLAAVVFAVLGGINS
ncbi:MAG: J domain-containing protein, partial [Roseimicrobium sp.]